MYNPLMSLWEGANGEGFLWYTNPMIMNIHSTNWQMNANIKLLNGKSLQSIVYYHMDNVKLTSGTKSSIDNVLKLSNNV